MTKSFKLWMIELLLFSLIKVEELQNILQSFTSLRITNWFGEP